MSASTSTVTPRTSTTVTAWTAATRSHHERRRGQSALADAVSTSLARSGKWEQWQQLEPRLAGFANLEEACAGWRRRDEECYQLVAALTALGSRRGGDDDDAALAVLVVLADGVNRVAGTMSDVCELGDVHATVWEEVKAAEPQLGTGRDGTCWTGPASGCVARRPADQPGRDDLAGDLADGGGRQ